MTKSNYGRQKWLKVLSRNLFTREEMAAINRCRLYLKVFFMSDIVSDNGSHIIPEIYCGERFSQWTSRWKWPRQPRPPNSSWKLWEIAITEVWAKSETLRLTTPLGDWLHKTHMKHTYKIDTANNILCEYRDRSKIKYIHDADRSTRSGMAFHVNQFASVTVTN